MEMVLVEVARAFFLGTLGACLFMAIWFLVNNTKRMWYVYKDSSAIQKGAIKFWVYYAIPQSFKERIAQLLLRAFFRLYKG